MEDLERQVNVEKPPWFLAPDSIEYTVIPAGYLSWLEIANHQKAFLLSQCHVFPSVFLDGKYKGIPLAESYSKFQNMKQCLF